jgi:hypothetical protein
MFTVIQNRYCLLLSRILCVVLLLISTVGAAPPADLALTLVTSVTGAPLAVRHAGDGSGRIFIVSRNGIIRIHDGTQLLPAAFLDISSRVASGGETGLLGLAFDPDFSNNRFFYVNYTASISGNLHTRISRFQVPVATPNVADATTELELLEIRQPYSNHNGGDIHFGADGYLYIGMGDGGSGGDPQDRARKLDNLMGKMLRIDVHGNTPGSAACGLQGNYGIPVDNPFIGTAGACAEIWSYGLRNPWRWSFDRLTNDMILADVGQGSWEEVNFQPAGSSGGEYYGWSCMEGNHVFNSARCDGSLLAAPILEYDHSGGNCSITGGYRYRGPILAMNGIYVYADYCTGNIWFAEPGSRGWTSSLWQAGGMNISSFGEDEVGNIYVVDLGGGIYRFDSVMSANDCSLANETVVAEVLNGHVFNCTASQSITLENFIVRSGGEALLRTPQLNVFTDASNQLSVEANAVLRVIP